MTEIEQNAAASLSEQAAGEFAQNAAKEQNARHSELEKIASKLAKPITFYEGIGALLGIILFLVIIFGAVAILGTDLKPKPRISCAVIAAIGILYILKFYLRKGKPVFTMSRTGILFHGTEYEVPWSALQNYDLHILGWPINHATTILFALNTDADVSSFKGGGRIKHVSRPYDAIRIKVIRYRGFNGRRLDETLSDGFKAGYAYLALKNQ